MYIVINMLDDGYPSILLDEDCCPIICSSFEEAQEEANACQEAFPVSLNKLGVTIEIRGGNIINIKKPYTINLIIIDHDTGDEVEFSGDVVMNNEEPL